MLHPELLPVQLQVLALAILFAFLAWVVRLIRAQRLSLRDSLLWLLTTLLAVAVTMFPRLLGSLAAHVGVQVPANAVFGAGLLYLAVNVLSVTLLASANAVRVRRLVQECALLRAEVEALKAEHTPAVDAGASEPPSRAAGAG